MGKLICQALHKIVFTWLYKSAPSGIQSSREDKLPDGHKIAFALHFHVIYKRIAWVTLYLCIYLYKNRNLDRIGIIFYPPSLCQMRAWAAVPNTMARGHWVPGRLAQSTCPTARTGWSHPAAPRTKAPGCTPPSPPCWPRRLSAT